MRTEFADFIPLHGSRAAANYLLHVSLRDRYVYVTNPKVACSSIKATLNMAEAARRGLPLTLTSMAQVHDRDRMPLLMPRDAGYRAFNRLMADPAGLVFSFVRDPVDRFCSAYLDKIAPINEPWKHFEALWAHLGLTAADKLSLEGFVAVCETDAEVLNFDPHWREQRRQIGFDVVAYDVIGRHARFAADFEALLVHLFGPGQVEIFDTRKAFEHYTQSPKLTAEIPADLKRRVERLYAADYAMLEEIEARELWRPRPFGALARLKRRLPPRR